MAKKGEGERTVDPIRDLEAVNRIRLMLEDRPRDQALFVFGVHAGLRACDLLRLEWPTLS